MWRNADTVAASDVTASSCARPPPLLRRIGCVVSYRTAGAIVQEVPGTEPTMYRYLYLNRRVAEAVVVLDGL